jgi:hypothetical protein
LYRILVRDGCRHQEEQGNNQCSGPDDAEPVLLKMLSRPELWLVEAKSAKIVRPTMASPLISLQRALQKRAGRMIVVNRKSRLQTPTAAIASGIEALDVEQFVGELLRT